jgi:predicted PurR-regulated permease PerM
LGAFLIGLPSWAALGIIAGLLEFVPYVGPVATGIPATLLALPKGLETVLWTLLMIVAVQQLEGLIITPLVQRQAVSLPPALTLFALIGMGILFGVAGVLLATPLTILLYVGMRDIYIPMIHQDGISLQEPKTLRM